MTYLRLPYPKYKDKEPFSSSPRMPRHIRELFMCAGAKIVSCIVWFQSFALNLLVRQQILLPDKNIVQEKKGVFLFIHYLNSSQHVNDLKIITSITKTRGSISAVGMPWSLCAERIMITIIIIKYILTKLISCCR